MVHGTALLAIYDPIPADLTPVGGLKLGWLYDCVFQEIDIATGDLLFEWRASEYVPINNTYHQRQGTAGKDRESAFDFFHLNSIDQDDEGNYIISSRHMHTISCIDRHTGEILWTLGGKTNEFKDLSDGEATNFAWQHDARWHANSTLTLLDNGSHAYSDPERQSRGLVIQLDIANREARRQGAYYHPQEFKSVSQGNLQKLDDRGRVLVGWGHSAAYSEYSADGQMLCDVHFAASAFFLFGRVVSYRVFKGAWVGNPQTPPDAEVMGDMIYASWNGATEAVAWQLEAWDSHDSGDSDDFADTHFHRVELFEKTGFETEIRIPESLESPLFRLAALDSQGTVLGTTGLLQRDSRLNLDELLNLHDWVIRIAVAMSACGLITGLYCIVNCRRESDEEAYFGLNYKSTPLLHHTPASLSNSFDLPSSSPSKSLNLYQAINSALRTALSASNKVMLFGEDVASGGIVGFAIGAAAEGMKPVAEIQFADYVFPAFDQIVNEAAKFRYREGATGVNVGGMSPESLFAHVPGVQVVMPRSPSQARGLLLSAIFESHNPVIFMEPKVLYRAAVEHVPTDYYTIPLNKAEIVKPGNDLTIVSYGQPLYLCSSAITAAEKAFGASIELIDLRTIYPWDRPTVLDSVKKTGRAMVVHESMVNYGVGAEVAATIQDGAFLRLEAPVKRVAGWSTHTGLTFEKLILPDVARIYDAIKQTLEY
ncbi:hypothetical protein ARAM_003919 [Aspergillus rambellii]|uniref:3-methyl-2-oxobutanoate dehydrogenase (2-methylpropanoyl-transferring) n=1 Tax=Aspergillus rambellii TaxID=308745 RepID=A0A0F8UVL8_9EURO|nr:hypothetical protein ARAM_003919 [Aspergillus rambellii]